MNPEVIVTHIKKRFTGVSGTVNALLPVQARTLPIAYLGSDMPGAVLAAQHCGERFARLSFWQALRASCTRLPDGRKRIWHVRRDPEMMLAIFLRDVLRLPISLVFTSAAKHRHSWFPRWLIANMDGVISTTPEAASYVPNTTRVVPHGISLERFSPPDNKLTVWQRTGLAGRIFLAGQQIVVVSEVEITHLSRGSVKGPNPLKSEFIRGYHHAQSKLIFERKYFGAELAARLRWKTLLLALLTLVLRLLLPQPRYLARLVGRIVGLCRA